MERRVADASPVRLPAEKEFDDTGVAPEREFESAPALSPDGSAAENSLVGARSFDNPIHAQGAAADEETPASAPNAAKETRRMLSLDLEDPSAGVASFDAERDDPTLSIIIALFNEYDADGGGTLDADELVPLLERLDRPADPLTVSRTLHDMWVAGGEVGSKNEIALEVFVEYDAPVLPYSRALRCLVL